MIDLVERLRTLAHETPGRHPLLDEAADEIERLHLDKRDLHAYVKIKDANEERLRAALYEGTTNGRWTEGEQRGEWAITPEVYEMMRRALEDKP